jgi:ABC-type transport system substrate-binding protein
MGTALLVSMACATPTSRSDGAAGQAPSAPVAPKILTISYQARLANFAHFTGAGAAGGNIASGNNNVARIAHNYLAFDDQGVFRPQIALGLPSVADGTWKVLPDGSMETIWKLRPNVKWQDGAPFTADDMVFTWGLFQDTDFPTAVRSQEKLMRSASAPDPQTFVIQWSATSVAGDDPTYLSPMPKHLLEELYLADKQALVNSPRLTSEFVGLGPYRITKWDEGVGIEFVRFDDYWMGRPPLDRVILKYIPDGSTAVANIMAGAVDVVFPPSVDLDTAADLTARWAGTGGEVFVTPPENGQYLRPQFRP